MADPLKFQSTFEGPLELKVLHLNHPHPIWETLQDIFENTIRNVIAPKAAEDWRTLSLTNYAKVSAFYEQAIDIAYFHEKTGRRLITNGWKQWNIRNDIALPAPRGANLQCNETNPILTCELDLGDIPADQLAIIDNLLTKINNQAREILRTLCKTAQTSINMPKVIGNGLQVRTNSRFNRLTNLILTRIRDAHR